MTNPRTCRREFIRWLRCRHRQTANGRSIPAVPDNHGLLAPGQTYTAFDQQLAGLRRRRGAGSGLSADGQWRSPDFYGINRTPETERFTAAVVALDADTGAVRWTFQAVHHDLWDYDLAAQPVLVDFPAADGPVPALIQATKTGQVFVLDRRDGHPLTKVEESAGASSRHYPASSGRKQSHTPSACPISSARR